MTSLLPKARGALMASPINRHYHCSAHLFFTNWSELGTFADVTGDVPRITCHFHELHEQQILSVNFRF